MALPTAAILMSRQCHLHGEELLAHGLKAAEPGIINSPNQITSQELALVSF